MLGERYLQNTVKILESLSSEIPAVKQAAELCAKAAIDGSSVYVYDKSGIIDNEMVDRASGLALFRKLSTSREKIASGDVVIIASIYENDADDMKIAATAHENGAKLIVLASKGQLYDKADIAVSSGSSGNNGVIEVAGVEKPFCPVSGIINATLAWSIVAETAAYLLNSDKTPTVYTGRYLKDGFEKFQNAQREFTSKGF